MRVLINAAFFLGFAVVLHLALAAMRFSEGGAASAGSGGEALMSAEASSASIAMMVQEWEQAPAVSDTVAPAPAPPQMTPPDAPQVASLPRPEAPARPELTPAMPLPPMPRDRALEPPESPAPPVVEQPPAPETPEQTREPQPDIARVPPKARPAPKPPAASVNSASSSARKAAGSGGGANAGEARSQQASTLSRSRSKSLQAQWGATIRARIERRKRAPRNGGSGTVVLTVSVAPSGQLLGVSVLRSSGQAGLDQAALRAVQAAGRFAAAPKDLSAPRYTFSLPITFAG
ncbi:energy transducer TonB family protein [Pseudodonghicola flavimaris]|uniref:TonB family protein n=1 Tax=Pseudodonghicola flavimaris TaxID=3050036 RepID=A0ABT7F5P0_9RHOB|nr:energy transducer TonB [Pseudodonghicola flavimaris]MDK3019820.1 TonB family protein [Pseudodonghicola flavimaris]